MRNLGVERQTMGKVTRKLQYRFNRKKVFDTGELQLWLDTVGGIHQPTSSAKLRLRRLKPGTQTVYETIWSGTISIDEGGATVTTTRLSGSKS
jgi:hypothetical protein